MLSKTFKLLVLIGFLFLSYKSYAQPSFTIQNIKADCEGSNTGSFEVLVSAATGPVSVFVFGPPNAGPIAATIGVPVVISGLSGAAFPGKSYIVVVQDTDPSATNVQILSYPSALSGTVTSVVDNTDCVVSNGSIDITPSGGSGVYTYLWEETSTPSFTATTQDVTGLLGGNYRVTIGDLNTNCTEVLPIITVANPSPVLFTLSSPTLPVCSGTDLVLNLSGSEPGVDYEVFRNNLTATGITQVGTGGPLSFVVPFGTFGNGDNFKVHAIEGVCFGDMTGIVIATIAPLPTLSGVVVGSVCVGGNSTNLNYSGSTGTPNQYSIDFDLTAQGQGFVDVVNLALPAAPASVAITVPVAAAPGNYNAILTVRNSTTGCSSTQIPITISVIGLPVPTITGPNDVCVNSTGNVYTTETGKTNYVWVVTGGTITAGGGAANNTVTVTWPTVGARSVSVNYTQNTCAASAPVVYPVNVKPLAVPTIVSGPNDVCLNSTGNIYTTQAGKTNYVWTVSGGTITAGGTATSNTATVTWTTVGARNISVNYSESGCPAATPFIYAVNVKPLPAPTIASGPNDVCINSTGNVYTTQAGKTNYVWTVVGGTITAGGTATDNTVTVTWTAAGAQSVSINYSENGCPAATPTVYPVNVKPLPVPTIVSGPNDVCVNSTGNVYTTQTGKTNYVWTVSAGGTITAGGTATSNTVTVTWTTAGARNVGVNYTENGCTTPTPASYAVNVKPLPTPTIASGPNDVCVNSTGNVYTTQAGKTNYVWTVSAGGTITAGGTATSNTVTVTWTTAGAKSVTINYSETGCTAAAPSSYAVNVKALPTPTIASGPNDVCINSTGNVYTTQAGKTNYVWTVVGGTITAGGTATANTATVTWTTAGAQSVSINYTENGCAAAAPTVYPVNVKPLPVPTIVSGPNDVCVNSTGNVYTTQPGKTNYVWTISAGGTITAGGTATSNTVTVTWTTAGARSVSVNYTENGCTVPTPATYAVNVKPVPTPTVASGPNDVCVNSTGNVYTTQTGKTNYVWTVSAGGTITAGGTATDNTVTVTWTTAGARSVSVNYSENGCAAATPSSYAVNVKALPVPTIASGPNDVCINSTGNVYTTQPGKTNYVWTVVGGTITAGGTATSNTATVTWTTAGAQSVSINYTDNGCTIATPSSYAVNVKPIPVPTITSGPAAVCVNSTGNVYTTQAGKTNYVWTVSAGGTITAGGTATANTVTVTWTTVGAKNVSVNYTEVGCTPATPGNLVVNVTSTPVLAANPAKTICSGDNAAYEILLAPANLPAGTVFNWPDPDGAGSATAGVNVPMGAAGTTHINDVLTNTTTAPIAITYVVTPSTGGCAGAPQNIVITVNPTPVLAAGQVKSICTGANVAYEILLNPAGLPTGTLFSWPDPDAAGPATAGVNVPAGAPGTIHINDVLTNTTTAPITVTYTITPSLGTCVGTPRTVVVTVNPLPVLVTPQVTSICSGDNVDYEVLLNPANLPTGTAFSWPDPDGAGPATAGANVPMGAAGTLHITDALTNTTGSPITLTYVITPSNGTCNGTPRNVLVTVDPAPALVASQAKSICTGDNVAYEILLAPANLPVGTVFNWPDPDGAGPATAGVNVPMGATGTTHINNVLTATGAPVIVTYVVTPTSGTGCDGAPQDVVITVNPDPVIAAGQTKTICSGANAGFEILMNPVNQPTGTVFNWADPDGAGPATAGVNVAMGTAGTIHINDALTNSTAAPITVTYVVTPSVGTCLGTPVNIDIIVDPFPAPVLVTPQTKSICSGSNTAYEILLNPANQPVGTLFNWPDPDGAGPATAGANVPMGAAGTTHINNVLTNTTNAPIAITYVVTPVSASGCTGTARNVVITVNPSPVLAASQSKTICSGANVGLEILMNPLNQPTGTVFNWPDPDGAGPATAGVNVAMGPAGTIHINDALTNSTAAPITVTYVVTPTVGTCIGTPENIDITIDPFPAPVLVTSQAKTICSGDNAAYEILLSPANQPVGTLFNWPDPDGAGPATAGANVPMGVAGTMHINDVLTNTTSAAFGVTYVVTPVSASGCVGTTRNVVITVNPSPVLAASQSKTICSGASVGYEILMNPLNQPTGTVFNWPDPDGAGPATAGVNVTMDVAGTIHINDMLTNSTAAPITVTYVVTPSVGTCTGPSENIDIIVDPFPAPVLVTPQAKTICSGENVAFEILLNPANQPPGTLFSWPDPDGSGPATAGVNVAMGAAGTTHINDVLSNTSSTPITVTYVVTPNSASGCAGTPRNVAITVNPAPVLAATQSTVICSGNVVGYHILLNPADQPVGTVFNWPDPDGVGPATAGVNVPMGTATTLHINDVLTNTTGAPITVTYTVTPTLGSCDGTPQNIVVTVRDAASTLCSGGGSDCANFSAIIPTIITQPSCNDRDAGEVSFTISRSNGTPTTFRVTWTYNGTDQTKFTSGTVSFDDLNSGLYKYTIRDEGNGMTCGPVDFFLDLKTQVEIQDKEVIANVTCSDGTDGNVKLTVDGTTTGEYWYKYVLDGQESVAQTFTPGAPLPGGLPADDDDFIIIKVDESFAFSCPDTVMVRIKHVYPRIDFAVASTQVTTCNGTDGGIQVTGITGGNTTTAPVQIRLKKEVPLSTDPSGYIVVADFEAVSGGAKNYAALAQGNYVVDIKDESDCIQSKPIAIQAPGQVPLALVDIIATDASCANEGASGTIQVTINAPGIYEVAVSQDQVNVPDDDQFVSYNSPSLPSITFNNLARGRYFLYIKSSTTECPTRSDVISIGGVYAVSDFDVLSNCENVNLTLNNLTGQDDTPFTIRVFNNNDKFFKIDSLTASAIPQSKSVSFIYTAPLQHKFLTEEGTYRFVMIQKQTTGAGTCTLVSDTVVYEIREPIGIVLGQVKPSFPDPKRTGSIEIENIIGGQRFVSGTNELYYEVSLTTADDDIVVFDWSQLKLNPQNKFSTVFDYLPPGVYRVKVRDATGCIKTQDVDVSLDPSVYVPNIFTPNDDGVNDELEILNLPADGKHKLIVSNRWGNEVYSSNDYHEGNFWNAAGTSDGIYFYRLQVAGGQTFTGWVEILRGNKP